MEDLYEIFLARLWAGEIVLHPDRWLKMRILEFVLTLHESTGGLEKRAPRASWSGLDAMQPLFRIAQRDLYSVKELRSFMRRCPRESRNGVYMATPEIAGWYRRHEVDGAGVERSVKDFLKELDPALRLEVYTPAGFVDCVTAECFMEVKRLARWKEGLGQLCAYSIYLPGLRPVLSLFGGQAKPPSLGLIRDVCGKYGVSVEYRLLQEKVMVGYFRRPMAAA